MKKSLFLIYTLLFITLIPPTHAVELFFDSGNNPKVEFDLDEKADVFVIASMVATANPGQGSINLLLQAEVKLDGDSLGDLVTRDSQNLSATASFRKKNVSSGDHEVTFPTEGEIGVNSIDKSLLVIAGTEESGGGGGGNNDDLANDLADLAKDVSDLQDDFDDLAAQVADLAAQIQQEIQDRIAADQQRFDDLVAMLDALESLLNQRIDALEAAIALLQQQVDTNTGDITALNIRMTDLENALTTLQQVLENRIDILEQQVANITEFDDSHLVKRIKALENRKSQVIHQTIEEDDNGLERYLIPAGIGLGGSILVNALWPRDDEEEDKDEENLDEAEAHSNDDRPGFGSK